MKGIKICLLIMVFFRFEGFAQDFSPFYCEVTDESGSILNPFTGGFLTPQLSLLDFDQDGDQDLFVFDRAGNVPMLFLWEDDEYVYHPEYKSMFTDLHSWALIRDFNNDGIGDIFAASDTVAGVQVRVGRIENGITVFDQISFPVYQSNAINHLFNGNYTNVYVASTDLPAISDVDGDGDLDILSFEPGGSYVFQYRNLTVENNLVSEALEFELVDQCYGRMLESEFTEELFLSDDPEVCSDGTLKETIPGTNKAVHSGSTLVSADFSGNGLDDLLIGDLTSNFLALARNGGTTENAWFTNQDIRFPPYDEAVDLLLMVSPFVLDIDHDGRQDLVAAPNSNSNVENIDNIWFYKNVSETDSMKLSLVQKDFLGENTIEFGRYTSPVFQDVNMDGLMDIIVGTSGRHISASMSDVRLIYLENRGTINSPRFEIVDQDWLGFNNFSNAVQSPAPTFGDLDGDGDIDLMLGTDAGYLIYYENTAGSGNPLSFANPVFEYADIKVGKRSKPAIIDIDGDGLADLVVGENNNNSDPEDPEIRGGLNFYRNIGSEGDPAFNSSISADENIAILGLVNTQTPFSSKADSAPLFVEDGEDYLLFVGSAEGQIFMYDQIKGNENSGYNLLSDHLGGFLEGKVTTPALADIDGDDFYEVLIGNFRGGLSFYNTDIISNTTSVSTADDISFSIYPNPVHDKVYLNGDLDEVGYLSIHSITGELVRNLLTTPGVIDVGDLEQGVYILKLQTKKGLSHSVRFVKIRQ